MILTGLGSAPPLAEKGRELLVADAPIAVPVNVAQDAGGIERLGKLARFGLPVAVQVRRLERDPVERLALLTEGRVRPVDFPATRWHPAGGREE